MKDRIAEESLDESIQLQLESAWVSSEENTPQQRTGHFGILQDRQSNPTLLPSCPSGGKLLTLFIVFWAASL